MRITFISDTHGLHGKLDLPGGDLIIHAGDISSMGYEHELHRFCKWFSKVDYDNAIFIAGNHELGIEDNSVNSMNIINSYDCIDYLQDDLLILGEDDYTSRIKIYGTPWQPEFCSWAFNLPKNSNELQEKWDKIPLNTDILITHCPPFNILDKSGEPYNTPGLGCELLLNTVKKIKPKIHVFGHIHGSYGYLFKDGTHFINASVLNEQYKCVNKPISIEWDKITNNIIFL